jgi:hypothetical protein
MRITIMNTIDEAPIHIIYQPINCKNMLGEDVNPCPTQAVAVILVEVLRDPNPLVVTETTIEIEIRIAPELLPNLRNLLLAVLQTKVQNRGPCHEATQGTERQFVVRPLPLLHHLLIRSRTIVEGAMEVVVAMAAVVIAGDLLEKIRQKRKAKTDWGKICLVLTSWHRWTRVCHP